MEYAIVYVEILVLCAVYALIILRSTTDDLGTNFEVRFFKMMMRVYIVMMVADGFTQLQYNDVIRAPLFWVAFAYSSYQFLLGTLSVLWLIFAEMQISDTQMSKRMVLAVVVVPLIVMFVLSFGSIRYGWYYTFDDAGHFVRGPLFPLMNAFAYIYFFATTVHAFVKLRTEKSLVRRRRLRLLGLFIVAPMIGATLQLVIGGYPFVPPSISIGFIFIFVNIQSDQINVDALTGLNNRKSMENYVSGMIENASEHAAFYLFVIDADRFKEINDSKGHVEGDRALRLIADALRATADTFKGFVSRYGGDEFVAVVEATGRSLPDAFYEQVDIQLKRISEKNALEYPLSVSAGCSRCATPLTSVSALIADADKMLYIRKSSKR
ncbi:MAG: GGDEF domain-containing protein [Lachnospiraceae bacterium]|nr:GGDEF domain-containing protein [Lachnospiraceae bacterium]